MVTLDLTDEELVTLIIALDLAMKNGETPYQKSQFNKLKSIIKKKSFGE
jgi:hypothetical protein